MPASERFKTIELEAEPGLTHQLFGAAGSLLEVALGLIALGGVVALYFLPFLLAKHRKHHQSDAILLTNLLLGWTAIGWVVALIWSATATDGKKENATAT
jgi:hypothetical protein